MEKIYNKNYLKEIDNIKFPKKEYYLGDEVYYIDKQGIIQKDIITEKRYKLLGCWVKEPEIIIHYAFNRDSSEWYDIDDIIGYNRKNIKNKSKKKQDTNNLDGTGLDGTGEYPFRRYVYYGKGKIESIKIW